MRDGKVTKNLKNITYGHKITIIIIIIIIMYNNLNNTQVSVEEGCAALNDKKQSRTVPKQLQIIMIGAKIIIITMLITISSQH